MQEQTGQNSQRFQFTGKGGEYFRIWIVNLLLSVLTLGIYSAWAKVRRLQYFYRNTHLAGASFDYHGTPMAILKGRLIGFGLLVLYNLTFQFSPMLGLAVALVLALTMPWLLMRSLRFKLYNSSYRGLRFGFAGDNRGAYRAFLMYPLLALMTLYLLVPLAHQRIKHYQFDNSRFGSTPFKFNAPVKYFYLLYLSMLSVMAGSVLLSIALIIMFGSGETGPAGFAAGFMVVGPFILPIMFIALLFAGSLFSAYMQNLVWDHTEVGAHQLFSELSARRLLWTNVTNFIGIALTFGLFIPFAAVRIARLRIESMGMSISGNLSNFIADQQPQATAAGEETAEMFDVDISF